MGSGGRRSPKGGLSNTGGAQKLKFKAVDPAAQNSMLAVQRQQQTGAALKAIHNYIDPTCYASNGFNHAQTADCEAEGHGKRAEEHHDTDAGQLHPVPRRP